MYLNLVHRQIFLDWRRAKEYAERNEKKPDKKREQNHVVIMKTVILPHAQLHSLSMNF